MRRTLSAAILSLALGSLVIQAADSFDLELNPVTGSPFYIGIPGPPGVFNRGMAAGDYDGDGDTDIVVTERGIGDGGHVRLMKNTDGRGTMSLAGEYGNNYRSSAIVSGDFDADGHLDAAITYGAVSGVGGFTGGISIFYGNGAANFTAQGIIPVGPLHFGLGLPDVPLSAYDVATADFNQDGRADLAAAADLGRVYYSINNGNRTFTTRDVILSGDARVIAAGDVTGDGDPDLIVGGGDGTLGFLRGLPGAGFGAFEHSFSAGLVGPTKIAIGDIDGDGDNDVVVAYPNNIAVFSNSGAGVFTHVVTSPAGFGNDVAIGDLDGITGGEIVTGASAGLGFFKFIPAGGMTPAQLKPLVPSITPNQGSWVLIAQMNRGAALDVIAHDSSNLSVYINGPADSTPPGLDHVNDVTAEATSPGGAVVNYMQPGAEDDVDGPVPASCSPASGSQFALGTTDVSCTAHDAAGNEGASSFLVVVRDTTPPSLTLPAAITVSQSACPGTAVVINASATDLTGAVTLTSNAPALYPVGTTVVTFHATDGFGNVATGTVAVTVVDNAAPAIVTAAPSQASLWPPNGRMESIDVSWTVSDCDAGSTCQIASVSSNEPAAGDWVIVDADTVRLRAARDGKGDGRVYIITIRCTDAAANTSTRAVTVVVPHDRGK